MPERRSLPSRRTQSAANDRRRVVKGQGYHTGAEGRAKVDEEIEKQRARQEQQRQQRNEPFRLRVDVGETRQVIICDDEPDFFRYEHNIKDPKTGKWGMITGCVKEFDNCPVCEVTGQEGYYAMYLTVIDLQPYTDRQGNEVEFSRKLMVIKPMQQKKFLRLFDREKTLRGALVELTRDSDKAARIGNDIEFVEFVPEEELKTYKRRYTDREGNKLTENCYEVYNYMEIFPTPSGDQLRALVGGEPTPGSDRQTRSALRERDEEHDWKDEDDAQAPWEEEEEVTPRPRARLPRRDEPEDAEPVEEAEAEPEAEPEPPRRSSTGRRLNPRRPAK